MRCFFSSGLSCLSFAAAIALGSALAVNHAAGEEKKPAQAGDKQLPPGEKKPAQPAEKKPSAPANEKRGSKTSTGKAFQLPEHVEKTLTDEQRAQLAEIRQEYAAQIETAAGKIDAILTPERLEAQKKAAASKLDELIGPDGKAELAAARQTLDDVQGKLREKTMSLLTDEQRAELKSKGRGDKAAGSPEKKPAKPRAK